MESLPRVHSPVSITIEVDSDPITGSIARPGHPELDFYGWLELLVTLDALHRGQQIEPVPDRAHEE